MTLYTVLQLVEKFDIDVSTKLITITDEAVSIGGTSADLNAGDQLTVEQLFYGMMLPSGNDAAF